MRDEMRDEVRDEMRDEVRDEMRDEMRDEVRDENDSKTSFFFLETYIYYISCIYLHRYMEQNVQNNYLMGLVFWTNWGPDQQKSKLPFSHYF